VQCRIEECGDLLKLCRVGLVVVLRVLGVFQGSRAESNKVVWTDFTNGRVNGSADLRGFRDIDTGTEVLKESLLVDGSSVQVDRADTDFGHGRSLSVIGWKSVCGREESCQAKGLVDLLTPFDCQNLTTGDIRAGDGARNVDTGKSGLRSSEDNKGRGKVEHFIEIDGLGSILKGKLDVEMALLLLLLS